MTTQPMRAISAISARAADVVWRPGGTTALGAGQTLNERQIADRLG